MLINATTQTQTNTIYVLSGNDDLNVASGVVLLSTGNDAILATTGQHSITVSGVVMAHDDGINLIGCEEAQTVVINAGGVIMSGYDNVIEDSDGVILDGVNSSLTNNGVILAHGSGLQLFVRDAGTTTVTNNGVITADKFGVWNKFGLGVLDFTNTGTIESPLAAFFGGAGVDNVTNTGTFLGHVELNGGDDLYLGLGGTVTGQIRGGDGDDTFVLGMAADDVDGGFGIDTLDFSHSTTAMVIDLADPSANFAGGATGDSYANIEIVIGGSKADVIRGDSADNQLWGRNGSDRLSGGDGQDTLAGGTGRDILTGGAGADVFFFAGQGDLGDSITDFELELDLIRLDGAGFKLGSYAGGLDPTRFVSGTSNAAGDADDKFIFNTTDATLWWDRDGTGTKFAAVLIADLNDGTLLTAAQIDII